LPSTIPSVNRLTVVVPATDAPATLDECVRAIQGARAAPDDLIVVDAPGNAGPAEARNLGVNLAKGDILVFVDSDVAVHADAFERINAAFASDPSLTAVFGSYDNAPRSGGVVSDFRNLLHHHVHQTAAGPASTFWAGLGAVRRNQFEAVGGFDARTFPRPSIEDIDLGMRLIARGGRIVLDPALQGKHLKRWTLADMVGTDFGARGVPWVALMLRRGSTSTALNLGWTHRLSATASLLLLVAVARRRLRLATALLLLILMLNHPFYRMLFRQRGGTFALCAVPLHVLHHLVGVAAIPAGARRYFQGRRQ
jgi:cellulose synthase/poly-beta-1,6-N-acetylglucosamine synthase-like glycosyltransferase